MTRTAQMARMDARFLRGLFADRLPPAKPTLLQLIDKAIVADGEFRTKCIHFCEESQAEWDRMEEAQFDTRAAFWAALEDETGITEKMIGKLA